MRRMSRWMPCITSICAHCSAPHLLQSEMKCGMLKTLTPRAKRPLHESRFFGGQQSDLSARWAAGFAALVSMETLICSRACALE